MQNPYMNSEGITIITFAHSISGNQFEMRDDRKDDRTFIKNFQNGNSSAYYRIVKTEMMNPNGTGRDLLINLKTRAGK